MKLSYIIQLLLTYFMLFSVSANTKAEERCKRIELNSSVSLEKSIDHCITIPIYTSDPIVITLLENPGSSIDEFKVQLVDSTSTRASVEETFVSNGLVTTHRSFKTSQRGEAAFHISPTSANRKTQTDVMYGRVNGVDLIYFINTNTPYTPVTPPSRPPVDECGGRNCKEINLMDTVSLEQKIMKAYSHDADNLSRANIPVSVQGNTSSGNLACNINNTPPQMPDDLNLNANIASAERYKDQMEFGTKAIDSYSDVFDRRQLTVMKAMTQIVWATTLFNDGKRFDLKKFGSSEDFGNFHYGAMLSAAGFEDSLIYSGASANQAWKDDGKGIAGLWGLLSGFVTQDRDHAHDTVQVTRGINYYKEVYKNDNNTTNVSDSCDDSNGLQIVAATGIGGGGPGGSIDPGVPGGARVSYKYSCELWIFPNGLGGHYYMNRNCTYKIIPY
ncbi:hypothetical protein I6M53_07785 [Shewanella algae]|uniref:polymorphic toxin type 44 domain-containing protein n=1 Tax=Shewanella algae TaxID=38313 RepID=UPI001AACFA9F|nr:polymorphic toxin type 44 domain-containing protein [Shewanella algae]MBO2674567.1 hypothetical protein [Shewanella algae]